MILFALAALQTATAPAVAPPPSPIARTKPRVATSAAPVAPPPVARATPMAERVAVFMALNKRTGHSESFTAKPGDEVNFDTLTIRLRACETTPPWEQRLTGAFLQVDDTRRGRRARLYSGWMFAESPSLNPLESALYDVWVRSCSMSFPATGPDTVIARALPREPAGEVESDAPKPKRSRAKKSPAPDAALAN